MSEAAQPPLVLHVVYRFDTGGLENGVVNLINHMPAGAYRHAVVALTEVTEFRRRVKRPDVEFISLHKPPGHGLKLYPQLWRLMRERKPAIVHTRNLAALEATVPAWAAGVPVRIHGEHGRDVDDIDGSSRKYQWMRRAYRPFVSQYVALSRDLGRYLTDKVGVPAPRVSQIYNGVDTQRFAPGPRPVLAGCPLGDGRGQFWVGTVGRMAKVKNQTLLARAFVLALQAAPQLRERLRLVMVGEGALREEAQALLDRAGLGALAWLPGERSDVADVMRSLDAFVLPSIAEGISNTILEAMATGLPVLATRVGGNAELVEPGRTGALVDSGDAQALAATLVDWASRPVQARQLGEAGCRTVQQRFSLDAMVQAYQALYDRQSQASRRGHSRH
ncbi:MAG: TIGR03088 family PEP-CTERM/XrtA system glycosyltransferase [Burkholderiales bacterium]|nr:TIGR03088 family PEP-CTERM/XrtA system glycosyltransferase [Burkholderiales bacterium]